MRKKFPAILPYRTQKITVSPPHSLYVEECGNPAGIPVLFVHGGPGGGCRETDRCFFDPERYRIILLDQRGCGRSSPHAELTANSTPELIADMETVRNQLGVDKWLVFGGSWGSTLALLYAQTYPEHIHGLILRGIFLCRDEDIRWFYQYGASEIFPDYWQDFIAPIPEEERHDFIAAYYRRLTGKNELERMAAAKAWSVWEARCSTLHPQFSLVDHFKVPHFALAFARIEAHFFRHQCFIRPNQILEEAQKLAGIPGVIVHGRYDVVCPVSQAYQLSKAWPEAKLEIIRDAGHSSSEAGTVDALVRATDAMADKLASQL